jgi:hypothetical protein
VGAGAAEAAVAGTRYYVKAFFVSQSYRQQREATPLTAADPVRPARNTAQHSTAQHSNEPFQGQFYCKLLLLLLLFARAFTCLRFTSGEPSLCDHAYVRLRP